MSTLFGDVKDLWVLLNDKVQTKYGRGVVLSSMQLQTPLSVASGGTGIAAAGNGFLKGDGTTLSYAASIASAELPIVPVNKGGLGSASVGTGFLKGDGSNLSYGTITTTDLPSMTVLALERNDTDDEGGEIQISDAANSRRIIMDSHKNGANQQLRIFSADYANLGNNITNMLTIKGSEVDLHTSGIKNVGQINNLQVGGSMTSSTDTLIKKGTTTFAVGDVLTATSSGVASLSRAALRTDVFNNLSVAVFGNLVKTPTITVSDSISLALADDLSVTSVSASGDVSCGGTLKTAQSTMALKTGSNTTRINILSDKINVESPLYLRNNALYFHTDTNFYARYKIDTSANINGLEIAGYGDTNVVGVRLQTTNGGLKTQIETFTDKVHILKPLSILGNSGAHFVGDNSADSRVGTDDSTRSFIVENTYGKFQFQSDLNYVCYLQNGNVVHTQNTGQSSERRLKQDIQPLTDCSNVIAQLNAVSYQYTQASGLRMFSGVSSTHFGFIVDEIEPILPEVVHTVSTSKLIHKEELVPHLVGCVQELMQRVANLEAQVAARSTK